MLHDLPSHICIWIYIVATPATQHVSYILLHMWKQNILQVLSCCSLWHCWCSACAVLLSTKEDATDIFWCPLAIHMCHILLFVYSVLVCVSVCDCLCGCALVCVCHGYGCAYARMGVHACVRARAFIARLWLCVRVFVYGYCCMFGACASVWE